MKRTCIDLTTSRKFEIIPFLSNSNNVVFGVENSSGEIRLFCYKREFINTSRKTISNNRKTYYEVYPTVFVCPLDLRSLRNTEYSFYKFEYLRKGNNQDDHIYNVKCYTKNDFQMSYDLISMKY